MRLRILCRLVLLSGLAASCRSEPTLSGKSLLCSGDDGCPDDMRCVDSHCVFNSLPTLAPFDKIEIVVGNSFEATAAGTDLDGDALTYIWTQEEGPAFLTEPAEGESLGGTLSEVGTYVFTVVANDTLADGPAQQLTVVARNAPPVIAPLGIVEVLVDEPFSIVAVVTEADGHAVTVTWEQIGGPDLGLGTVENDTLAFTPTVLGRHAFRALANDGYEDSEPEILTVVALPVLDVVYVSDTALTAEECGPVDAPCPTLEDGLAVARATVPAIDTILVAANRSTEAYDHCLDLAGTEALFGSFDADTWDYDPTELRPYTRIQCDAAAGHMMSGDASLWDLTLLSSVPAPVNGMVVTLTVAGAAAELREIDVEGAACGSGCAAIGIEIQGGAPLLLGVDVRATETGFNVLDNFLGIYVRYSDATIIGPPVTRAIGDGERGVVSLNVPVNSSATGIAVAGGSALIETMVVEGGLGVDLAGVGIFGATATVRDTLVDLTGFGSQSVTGIYAGDCLQNDWPCQCLSPPCSDLPVSPLLEALDNDVFVRSAADSEGQVPCGGVGIAVQASARGHVLTGNNVTLAKAFSLASGIAVVTPPDATEGDPDRLERNTVTVEDGRVDVICAFLFAGPVEDVPAGLAGVVVVGAGTEARFNTVTVGSHDYEVFGLAAPDLIDGSLTDNDVLVATPLGSVRRTPTALAASLGGAGQDPHVSELARNRLAVGEAALGGVALYVDRSARWRIANNFLSGGDAVHAVGVKLQNRKPDADWPVLVHNTIYGGGAAGQTLTSHGVVIDVGSPDVISSAGAGILENNLIDGGDGLGRRYLIDNVGPGFVSDPAVGNKAQIVGNATGPRPTRVIAPRAGVAANGLPHPYLVIGSASAEVLAVTVDGGGTIRELVPTLIPGRPLTAWDGGTDLGHAILVGIPGAFAISYVGTGSPSPFATYATRSAGGMAHHPTTAVIANANESFPQDVIFLEDGAGAGDAATAWVMGGDIWLGYQPPRPLDSVELFNPVMLAATTSGNAFFLLDRPLPEDGIDDVFVNYYPLGVRVSILDALALIGGDSETPITLARFESFGELLGWNKIDDLVIIADNEVIVIGDVDLSSETPSFSYRPLDDAACEGVPGIPIDVQAGYSSELGASHLWILCDDGTLELYEWVGIFASLRRIARQNLGADVTDWEWFTAGGEDALLVSRADANLVDVYGLNGTTFEKVNPTFQPSGLALLPHAAMRTDPVTAPELESDFSVAGFDLLDPADACSLAFRSGGAAGDLHITDDSASCVDQGVALGANARTDDIDGEETRPGPDLPDVGADER